MKDRKPDIIYSDPVKEIMGRPPGSILRWGTIVMFLIFIVFILFAWLIRYPDTIPSPVEITTTNPPVTMVSKKTGHIVKLEVNDRDTVAVGQLLAVIETAASLEEIYLLKQIIDTLRNPLALSFQSLYNFTELGELQGYYASFYKAFSDLESFKLNDIFAIKIRSLSDEIIGIQKYIDALKEKENLYAENLNLEEKKFTRIKSLFDSLTIPAAEVDLANQSLLDMRSNLVDVRLQLAAKSIEISAKRHELDNTRSSQQEQNDRLNIALIESFGNLKAQSEIWEKTYLLISPVDGIVSFTNIWKENQLVNIDEEVLSVIPLDPGKFIGRINLNMQRSGKVDSGLHVNIKLSAYPYMQYGTVEGIIRSKSQVPSGDTYIIEIDLPHGLITSYGGKPLKFTQKMQGTAEIMTDDIRLLQKIINPFRYLVSKNKR